MGRKNALMRLASLVVVTTGLTAALHHLGANPGLRIDWADPVNWLNNAAVEDAIGATLRMVGLAIGYWITISTSLYMLATLRNGSHRPRLLTVITLPGIRRVVDRALATALAASIAASPLSPALAEQPPPPPVVLDITRDGIPVPHVRITSVAPPEEADPDAIPDEAETEALEVLLPPVVAPTTTAVQPAATTTDTTDYTVRSGDSLWRIADRHVQNQAEGEPTTAAITAYWREVVDANQGTLRSGDPNLIFPGEIVVLPTLEVNR